MHLEMASYKVLVTYSRCRNNNHKSFYIWKHNLPTAANQQPRKRRRHAQSLVFDLSYLESIVLKLKNKLVPQRDFDSDSEESDIEDCKKKESRKGCKNKMIMKSINGLSTKVPAHICLLTSTRLNELQKSWDNVLSVNQEKEELSQQVIKGSEMLRRQKIHLDAENAVMKSKLVENEVKLIDLQSELAKAKDVAKDVFQENTQANQMLKAKLIDLQIELAVAEDTFQENS